MASGYQAVKLASRGGRVLVVIVAAILVTIEVANVVIGQLPRSLTLAPIFGFVVVASWSLFWAPTIAVDEVGVTIVNPLREWRVPWSAIRGTESRWALTVVTPGRKITAWAAPRQNGGS